MKGLIEKTVERVLLGEESIGLRTSGPLGHRIVICQRGFVFAGDVYRDGDDIVITDAVNIRKWGTSKGLGQLAAEGNQPNTKCDPAGTVRVHRLAVIAQLDCMERIRATA